MAEMRCYTASEVQQDWPSAVTTPQNAQRASEASHNWSRCTARVSSCVRLSGVEFKSYSIPRPLTPCKCMSARFGMALLLLRNVYGFGGNLAAVPTSSPVARSICVKLFSKCTETKQQRILKWMGQLPPAGTSSALRSAAAFRMLRAISSNVVNVSAAAGVVRSRFAEQPR